MRNLITLAAALLAMATLTTTPSRALPVGAGGVRTAAATVDPVERVGSCWRFGWHGWGWYPCYYYYPGYTDPRWRRYHSYWYGR
jgi:hypothetical protein